MSGITRKKRLKLIKARKSKKLTQEDVATIIGVSRSFYSQIETGERNPRYETCSKICLFFDLDINSWD